MKSETRNHLLIDFKWTECTSSFCYPFQKKINIYSKATVVHYVYSTSSVFSVWHVKQSLFSTVIYHSLMDDVFTRNYSIQNHNGESA